MKRIFPLLVCFVLIVGIIVGSASPVSAAVLDLADYSYDLYYENNQYYMSLNVDGIMEWRRYVNGTAQSPVTGNELTYYQSEYILDNTYIEVYPFGLGNYISVDDVTVGAAFHPYMNFVFSFSNLTQSLTVKPYWFFVYCDADGNVVSQKTYTLSDQQIQPEQNEFKLWMHDSIEIEDAADYFYWYARFDFDEIVDETSTVKVKVVASGANYIDIPLSSLYAEYLQTGEMNELLLSLETQLAENNLTIEQVLASQNEANEKLDGIQGSINDTNDKLDDTNEKLDEVISGGDAGEDLIGAADDLDTDNEELDGVVDDLESAECDLLRLYMRGCSFLCGRENDIQGV